MIALLTLFLDYLFRFDELNVDTHVEILQTIQAANNQEISFLPEGPKAREPEVRARAKFPGKFSHPGKLRVCVWRECPQQMLLPRVNLWLHLGWLWPCAGEKKAGPRQRVSP